MQLRLRSDQRLVIFRKTGSRYPIVEVCIGSTRVRHNTDMVVYKGFYRSLIHCVSKNDTDVAYYNFNAHQPILVILAEILLKE